MWLKRDRFAVDSVMSGLRYRLIYVLAAAFYYEVRRHKFLYVTETTLFGYI